MAKKNRANVFIQNSHKSLRANVLIGRANVLRPKDDARGRNASNLGLLAPESGTLQLRTPQFEDSVVSRHAVKIIYVQFGKEPPHGKTNNLHRRKQRRRSASQTAKLISAFVFATRIVQKSKISSL